MRRLITTLALSLLATAAFASERRVQETLTVNPDVRLAVETYKGKVTIRTANVNGIEVEARIYPDEGPIEDLEAVEIRIDGGSSSARIEVDYDESRMKRGDGWGFFSGSTSLPFVDLDITMPAAGSLRLEDHKGTLDIQAPSGLVQIDTHKGVGRVYGVTGDLELSTHKGEIRLEVDQLADLDVETHKGDILVDIGRASDFTVRGETHKGHLELEGRRADHRRGRYDDDDELWYEEGSGEHRVRLSTHKGSIVLRFR